MSDTIPWKVGTAISDSIVLRDSTSFAGITGKVQGDFTIQVSKGSTGNVSTTGITITETDAINNPGDYDFAVDGSTGFVAATGEYTAVVFLTALPQYCYAKTFYVTSDGTFAGTVGAASFTATASDGRITDGAVALQDATVRIRNSANTILAQFTSDASGLWGPVYLSTGTYTIDVQKAGYTASNSKTIVVSGATATGPLVDIAIAVATSGTGLTASDLWAYARRMARNRAGAQATTELTQAVNDALDMVSMEQLWPFLLTQNTLSLNAFYQIGTITLTQNSSTVTLAAGTWPIWAASGKIKYNGQILTVASRSSASDVLLDTAWNGATTSGASYLIFQDEYALASDLMKLGRLFPGNTWGWGGEPVSYEYLMEVQNDHTYSQKYPKMWATVGNRLIVWPYPSDTVLVNYSYYKKPASLVNASDEADWDPMQRILLYRAIDYQVSLRYEDCVAGSPAQTLTNYKEQLTKSRPMDKTPMGHYPAVLNRSNHRDRDFVPPAS